MIGVNIGIHSTTRPHAPARDEAEAAVAALSTALYLPSDPTSLYADAAGTIPASVDGPVSLILDKAGMGGMTAAEFMALRGYGPETCPGHHAITGAPAMLRESGGHYYIETDGNDDFFALPAGLGRNVPGIGVAAGCRFITHPTGATQNPLVYLSGTSAQATRFAIGMRGESLFIGGRRLDSDTFNSRDFEPLPAGTDQVLLGILDYTAAGYLLRRNGIELGSGAFLTPGSSSDTPSAVARLGAFAAAYTRARIYSVAIRAGVAWSGAEQAMLEAFHARAAGLAA